MYAAFAAGAELTDDHLRAEVKATRPLSVLMGERVAQTAGVGRRPVRPGGLIRGDPGTAAVSAAGSPSARTSAFPIPPSHGEARPDGRGPRLDCC